MYRSGDGSELNSLVSRDVLQIGLGEFETQVVFSDARLSMEGSYVHRIPAENGENRQTRSSSGPNELYRLIGKSILKARVLSPESAELVFSNGDTLTLIDDSDHYESFVLTLPDKIVVV
jgi:hypothetical protein